ncbi:MAG: hypothetical protein K2K80_05575 [Clostridia bacterium]|nr:hypothetical protein [Clostridia bacterium]
MAIKNSVAVYIDGVNLTSNTVLPLKIANFLDERLDECQLSLRGVKKEHFAPLTPVEVVVNNELYWGNKSANGKTKEKISRFIIANDSASEMQIGRGLYNHDLYLIEVTKVAECFVVDTITFTNDLGRIYAAESDAMPDVRFNNMLTSANVTEGTSNGYKIKSGVSAGDVYIPSFGQLNTFRWVIDNNDTGGGGTSISYDVPNRIFVYKSSDYKVRSDYVADSILEPSGTIIAKGTNGDIRGGSLNGITVNLDAGSYVVEYTYLLQEVTILRASDGTMAPGYPKIDNIRAYCCTYYFTVVENKLPLKEWTITDVIERTLDLAEPLRKGEKPRFKLNAVQADLFDKILSPQLSFTKQTLRECLQEIGKVIHGEPRITPNNEILTKIETKTFTNGRAAIGNIPPKEYDLNATYKVFTSKGTKTATIISVSQSPYPPMYYLRLTDNSNYSGQGTVYSTSITEYYYEVSYDMYASQERSRIYSVPYIKKDVSQVIDNYATYLDSNAENLVNQIDKFSGVIVEPYRDGAKSLRTENLYVRIEDGNMLIPTQYPVYTVDKLEYVYTYGRALKSIDITAWLFEKSVYDTQLSSYSERYPFSKAYGIYYSQGEKNICGLNFKVDAAVFADFKNYSITNILRDAAKTSTGFNSDYPKMAFRITYTPFYNVRVAQTKPNYREFKRPAGLIYNQASNVIESRYYGENLKGAIARIGNVEKSLTYLLYDIQQIPKAGQMFDNDYYVSVVKTEILPTVIKCTIGLSKDFNRLSAYIGINSERRYSEISQNQAVERNTLYREYIVIGAQETPDDGCLIGNKLLAMIADTFTQNGSYSPLSNVCAWGTSYQGTDVANGVAINLPVISSAYGNSISFSWRYADNYSAGDISVFEANAFTDPKEVSGYFQNSQPYTDYYGRLYYYKFDLQMQGPPLNVSNINELPLDLPKGTKPTISSGYVSTVGQQPLIMRKDNREALQVNFQIDFVTNLENFIIGSALASYCPAVRGSGNLNDKDNPLTARLYVFDTDLNKFTDHVEAFENVDLSKMQSAEVSVNVSKGYFTVSAGVFPTTESGATNGKSWAIITAQHSITKEVENEKGDISTQTKFYGGDLLIGRNQEVTAGRRFTPIYFTLKREIFDKTVWKDRR